MSKKTRLVALLMAVFMLLSAIPAVAAAASDLPYVEIEMWMTGSEADDLDSVLDAINELALEDLNCKLNFHQINDSTEPKYTLLLATGDTIDLIYTANYLNYVGRVNQGAFTELEELIKANAPDIWAAVPEANWDAVRVNGGIYMIPTVNLTYVAPAFAYREDLRKKYDLPEIVDLDTISLYLKTIAANEPDMYAAAEYVSSGITNMGNYFTAWPVFDLKYRWTDWRLTYGMAIDYDNPTNIYSYWDSDDFRTDMKLMKEWADAGVWSRSALASTEDQLELFRNGKTAGMLGSFLDRVPEMIIEWETEHPDWEIGMLCYDAVKSLSLTKHPTQDGQAIPISTKNPERALMLYSKMMLDARYNRLARYGIEGKHYTIDENGYYVQIPESGYETEAMRPWAYRNDSVAIPTRAADILQGMYEQFNLKDIAYVNISSSFAEDSSSYTAERAALMNVISEYLVPIQAGFVDDVDAAIDEFLRQARLAGLDKVQSEYKAQWLKYVEENDVKPTKIEY